MQVKTPTVLFLQDDTDNMNIEVIVPSGSRNGSPSPSSSGNTLQDINGMSRHSLATLEGVEEFVVFYRAFLPLGWSPHSLCLPKLCGTSLF